MNPFPNPDLIEGHPRYPAPWKVCRFTTEYGTALWEVRSADRLLIIPGCESEEFCQDIARSRNEGTDEEAIAYLAARYQRALDHAHETTERVRAHFLRQMAGLSQANDKLKDAIASAIRTGKTDYLPRWCLRGKEVAQSSTSPATLPGFHEDGIENQPSP
jgi:hypothetical protein